MELPFKFVKYTDISEPQISIVQNKTYHYLGNVRDGISEDIISVIDKHMDGEKEVVYQRIRDFINTILRYQNDEYIHIQLYMEMKSDRNSSYQWHYDYSYSKVFTVAIKGDTTVFLIPNEYNREIMRICDEDCEPIDLNNAFISEEMVCSLSNEMSIFDGSSQEAIHSSPNTSNDRIFISAIFGSYDQVYEYADREGEQHNWMMFSHERSSNDTPAIDKDRQFMKYQENES